MLAELEREEVEHCVRKSVSLAQIMRRKLSELDPFRRALVAWYVRAKRSEILNALTEDAVLEELESKRPDIADLLKHEPGLSWLRRNLKEVRQLVLSL